MSEYQYYEFQTIERLLTEAEQLSPFRFASSAHHSFAHGCATSRDSNPIEV